MAYKIVQNYQLLEESSYVEDGIDIYIARHNVSKLPYLLKKVNTKQSSDRLKYQSLINEIGILKLLSSPSIVECHKMLKTSNNIYLVYDYCDGSPLSDIMKTSTKQLKINIVSQLLDALKVMGKASIVHGNLKPSSIIVSSDNKIKVMNFSNGHNRQNNKTIPLKFKPTPSVYVAPQIKRGIIHEKTDLYSLGVILSQMDLVSQKDGFLSVGDQKISELPNIIKNLMSEDPDLRSDIQQIQFIFKGGKENSPRKKSYDPSDRKQAQSSSSLKKTKSLNSNKDSDKKQSSATGNIDTKLNEKKFVEQILKKRNFAIYLLQMAQTCLKLQQEERKLGVFLSFILMKKSCKAIEALLGFLKGDKKFQKQIQKINLDKVQRAKFEKKPDFFRIISTIQKQAGNQKRWMQQIYRNISPDLPPKWKQYANEEVLEDKIMSNFVIEFLSEVVQRESIIDQITNKLAQNLYLMSEIIPHKSYEKMFQEMISEEKISLDEQYLYIHVRKMDKKQLLSQISFRIQSGS